MDKSVNTKRIFGFFWEHASRYPRLLWGGLISLPLGVLVQDVLPPLIVAQVLSRLAEKRFVPGDVWGSFGPTLIGFIVLLLIGAVIWRVIDIFNWRLEGRVTKDLAEHVYDHVLSQSANFHANTFGGSLVSHTNKLLGAYIRIADTTLYQTLQLVSMTVFTVIVLAPRAPVFVLCLVLFAAMYITAAFHLSRPVRDMGAEHAAAESRQTGYLADSITNVMAIKSFATLQREKRQFSKDYTSQTRSWLMKLMRVHHRQLLYFGIFNRIIEFSALLIAVISVVVYSQDIGVVFLIFSYTNKIIGLLWMFCNSSLRNYNRSLGDASKMIAILDTEAEIKDPAQPEPARITKGAINFRNVTFTHDGAKQPLFKDLDIAIKPGEKVGLVGHSGSGKTSFTRILLRFSDIDSGEILIDGQNISSITQDDLRRHVAYVPQEPLLFHRSLTENICYGKPDVPQEEVIRASKMAHAHEFIKDLPLGYDTLVGERGVKLSGGQRQRVAIARAMIKDAPVLVLDEATSALDSESERLIQQALWKLMEGRTTIVIAHRLSTIQKMDRIIVMADGKIVEEGSHQQLLKKKGTYAELWAHQSGGFLED